MNTNEIVTRNKIRTSRWVVSRRGRGRREADPLSDQPPEAPQVPGLGGGAR
jgi:hypothetical protein